MENYGVANINSQVARRSEQRLRQRRWFYWHVVAYFALNVIWVGDYLINSLIEGQLTYFWLPWPMAVFAAALAVHYLALFRLNGDLRQRMTSRLLQKRGVSPNDRAYGQAYHDAYSQAGVKIGFYWHLVAWLIVNGLCLISYGITAFELGQFYYFWPVWSFVLTSLFVVAHWLWIVFFDGSLRQRLLTSEIERSQSGQFRI